MTHTSYRHRRHAGLTHTVLVILATLTLFIGGDRVPAGAGETAADAAGTQRNGPDTTASGTAPPPAPEPGAIPNAYPMSLTTGGARPVSASWTYIDGLEGLNAQLDSWLLA